MLQKLKEKQAFTLAELLIVVAIIAVLVAIGIPIFVGHLASARGAKLLSDLRSIDSALMIYYVENGTYPDNIDALEGVSGWRPMEGNFAITGGNGKVSYGYNENQKEYGVYKDADKAGYGKAYYIPEGYTEGPDGEVGVGTVAWYLGNDGSSSGGGSGGGTGTGGFTIAAGVDATPQLKSFFESWNSDKDESTGTLYRYQEANGYVLVFSNGNLENSDIKDVLSQKYNIDRKKILIAISGSVSNTTILTAISTTCGLPTSGDGSIEEISYGNGEITSIKYR